MLLPQEWVNELVWRRAFTECFSLKRIIQPASPLSDMPPFRYMWPRGDCKNNNNAIFSFWKRFRKVRDLLQLLSIGQSLIMPAVIIIRLVTMVTTARDANDPDFVSAAVLCSTSPWSAPPWPQASPTPHLCSFFSFTFLSHISEEHPKATVTPIHDCIPDMPHLPSVESPLVLLCVRLISVQRSTLCKHSVAECSMLDCQEGSLAASQLGSNLSFKK